MTDLGDPRCLTDWDRGEGRGVGTVADWEDGDGDESITLTLGCVPTGVELEKVTGGTWRKLPCAAPRRPTIEVERATAGAAAVATGREEPSRESVLAGRKQQTQAKGVGKG